jgi:phosphatidylglycerol:prolipoprotein diacylglycerol transferase
VTVAILLYAHTARINKWFLADCIACAAPIGLGLGRVANFINGELWGRPAPDVPWAMVFPGAGDVPRHPSQLYQATLEGLVLFVVMHLLWRNEDIRRRPGMLTGCFWIGYGVFRITGEFFREPDAFLGFLFGGVTMGQLLCIPMILFGIFCLDRARRAPRAA